MKPAARLRGLPGNGLRNAPAIRAVPFAAALALTRTAQAAQKAGTRRLAQVLDNPVPFIARSVKIQSATTAGRPARVFVKDDVAKGTAPARILHAMEHGGPRRAKRFEKALRALGVLDYNEFAIPADGGSIDLRAGRATGGLYTRLIRGLRNQTGVKGPEDPMTGSARPRRSRIRAKYFRSGAFVWERLSKTLVRPLLIVIARAPRYRPVLRFGELMDRTARREAPRQWAAALARSTRR